MEVSLETSTIEKSGKLLEKTEEFLDAYEHKLAKQKELILVCGH